MARPDYRAVKGTKVQLWGKKVLPEFVSFDGAAS